MRGLTPQSALAEVEILAIERAELHVLQCQRVGADRYDYIVSILTGVSENACEIIERAPAKVDCIVPMAAGRKICYGVMAEIRRKYKGIGSPFARQGVIS